MGRMSSPSSLRTKGLSRARADPRRRRRRRCRFRCRFRRRRRRRKTQPPPTRPGRGLQLQAGAAAAKGEWFLFLHADTALEAGWETALNAFMKENLDKVGYFRFAMNDSGFMPRLLECLVAFRCRVFALPYGDQALFIPRAVYDQAGGYGSIPLMEDVEFVRRLGRGRLRLIDKKAISSASRYKAEGYWKRILRNFCCLTLYWCGMRPSRIKRLYG